MRICSTGCALGGMLMGQLVFAGDSTLVSAAEAEKVKIAEVRVEIRNLISERMAASRKEQWESFKAALEQSLEQKRKAAAELKESARARRKG